MGLLGLSGCQTGVFNSPYNKVAHKMNSSLDKEGVKALVPTVYLLTTETPTKLRYMLRATPVNADMLEFRFDKEGRLEWASKLFFRTDVPANDELKEDLEKLRKSELPSSEGKNNDSHA